MKKFLGLILAIIMVCMPLAALAEDEVNYSEGESALSLGTATYAVSADFDYTVYMFEPGVIGKYTISVDKGLIGIVSYLTMWVQNIPSEENVNASSVEWDCTDENQGIYVAVAADAESVDITVSKEEIVIKQIQWTIYENKHTPVPFTFELDENELEYVDIEDDVIDDAVLGDDGYYHLNSADGPVLYVDFDNGDYLSEGLKGVISTASLKYVTEPEVSGIDYTQACGKYIECADEATALYPLTADLIEIYKNSGVDKNWYGEGGYIAEAEDAWMFSCFYIEGNNRIENGTTDNNGSDNSGSDSDVEFETVVYGDINENGNVDMLDYILLKRNYFGTYNLTEAQLKIGDINKNEKIDMVDYILLKRIYFGTYKVI